VRDDPDAVAPAVEEALRFVSPVQFSPRRVALEDVEWRGVTIRKGEGVFALPASANRDAPSSPSPTAST
jgi:cytochrome P450